jgi:hypothetical protein
VSAFGASERMRARAGTRGAAGGRSQRLGEGGSYVGSALLGCGHVGSTFGREPLKQHNHVCMQVSAHYFHNLLHDSIQTGCKSEPCFNSSVFPACLVIIIVLTTCLQSLRLLLQVHP